MSIFKELKRRNVFRVAVAYLVIGWLVLQVADLVLDNIDAPSWVMQTLFLLVALGFFIALLISWAYEITPEGIKKQKDVDRDQSITHVTAKKLDVITLFAVLVLLGMIVWQQFQPTSAVVLTEQVQRTEQQESVAIGDEVATENSQIDASIAVLPFADLSSKSDQEYFSDGIAEEILNVLVKVSELEVASRTSSFQFKGRGLGIPEIARKLKVRHVLEGSVRKAGDNIRITAQLIEAETDKHLWSETYDRPLTTENIFAIQDEIAKAIVAAMGEHLGLNSQSEIKVKQSTNNLTAYELYLEARPLFLARLDLDVADKLLEQAVTLDPNFAKAWEVRAALQSLMGSYNYTDMTKEEQKQKLYEFADKALALEPNSATAIASKALVSSDAVLSRNVKVNVGKILQDFEKALKIEPKNGSALNWKGLLLQNVGYLEQALASFRLCIKYEPYYTPCSENVVTILSELGRDQEAMDFYLQTLNQGVRKTSYAPLASLARLDMEILFKTTSNHEDFLSGWSRHEELYQAFKNPEKNRKALLMDIEQHLKGNSNTVSQYIDILLNPLGRFPQNNTLGMWDAVNHKGRQGAEFRGFIKTSGILDFWQEHGFPPQCRASPNNDFECD